MIHFHSTYINIKSDKSSVNSITSISHGTLTANDPISIGNLFNNFFTSLSSVSTASTDECIDFSNKNYEQMKEKLKFKNIDFKFHSVSNEQVEELISELENTKGPGITGIPIKLFKSLNRKIYPMVTNLFNNCIKTSSIPTEWKTAIVTPLYKQSGAKNDMNNYRGISVLPPIGKIFERILVNQIKVHLLNNNLLFHGQYGFRNNHSCESALHEILSNMFKVLSERKIGLYFFVDFRKAFDLISFELLLYKLKLFYGFNENSIKLLKDYLNNRYQYVKIDSILSNSCEISLGVPQGSVLGPLLFLLFINDMPFFLKMFLTVLFADDTTLGLSSVDYNELIKNFIEYIEKLIIWCHFNKIDINWKKSQIMFITNKRAIKIPDFILINNHQVKVVSEFKLLGIIIDDKLNFIKNTCKTRKSTNTRLYSIQKLFYLPISVKIQFIKTFILPYFDYCATICIYFSSDVLQKLANTFNNCVFRLLKSKKLLDMRINSTNDFNIWNNYLTKYNLYSFQHRLLFRLHIYIYKIFHNNDSPHNLLNSFVFNRELNKKYNLRNLSDLHIPSKSIFNDFGERSFSYFFSKFINELCRNDIEIDYSFYKIRIKNNINLLFLKFVEVFVKFDLKFKIMFIKK